MRRRFLFFSLCLLLLSAACAGPAASPTPDGGWVELGDDFVLDEASIARVTPAPVEPVSLSQAEAQAQLPFEYALPGWAPAGFVLQDMVEVVQPASGLGYTSVSFTWLTADETALYLQVAQSNGDQPALGAAGTSESTAVNGQPATLVHTSRLGADRLSLTWQHGDLTYTLTAAAGAATPEELLRMAEAVG